MKKTCLLALLFLVLGYKQLLAQSGMSALGFPSPNNDFLGKIGTSQLNAGVDVDVYTGSAMVNIPLCDLPAKDFHIPVSLSYTGGRGIRLQDYATSVGLGWQLVAGGSITRVVRGFPDEQPNGYFGGCWGAQAQEGHSSRSCPDTTGIRSVNVDRLVNVANTVSPLAIFGYSTIPSKRSIVFEQLGNTNTATQYFFLNGGLGSNSVLGSPYLTSMYAPSFGMESSDANLSILTAPQGTKVTPVRAMTFLAGGNVLIGKTS